MVWSADARLVLNENSHSSAAGKNIGPARSVPVSVIPSRSTLAGDYLR